MSAQNTLRVSKPSARVLRGLHEIHAEMGCVADVKYDEGKEGRQAAEEIRAALVWISFVAKTLGGTK